VSKYDELFDEPTPQQKTHDGLPALVNSDGSHSTELSITVTNPKLNGGRPTNIPSLWNRKVLDEDSAVNEALKSKRQFPSFTSIDEAVKAAESRSAAGGAGASLAVELNADAQPDRVAEANAIARRYNMPPALAEHFLEDYKAKAKSDDTAAALKRAPKLGSWIASEPDRARLTHDDIENLANMEERITQFGELKPWRGPAPSMTSIAKGIWESFKQGGKQVREGLRMQGMDAMGEPIDDPLRRYNQATARIDASTPEFETATARGLYGGLSSTARVLPGIAAAIATRNPNLGLLSMGVQSEAEAYGKYRARGATPGMALVGGVGEGAVEVATEMLPMGFLVDKFGKVGAKEFLAGMLGREVPTEQVATFLQDAIDTAVANPDKTWGQFMQERPDAAYQTLLATVVQTSIFGAANSIAARLDGGRARAEYAETQAERLQELQAMSGAVKTLQRDAVTAKSFIAQVAEEEGDAPTEFFVSGEQLLNTLNQSGMSMQELEAVAPVVAAQLQAAETGTDVRLPVSEFMGLGEKITAPLIDHIRVGENEPTRLEAKDILANEQTNLDEALKQRAATQEVRDEYAASVAQVRDKFQAELDKMGRYRPDVNKAYATLLANFFGSRAVRMGKSVDEMVNLYRLYVQDKSLGKQGAGTTMEQRAREIGGYKVKEESDGGITVFGDQAEVRSLMPEGVKGRLVEGGVYFTPTSAQRVTATLAGEEVQHGRAGGVTENPRYQGGERAANGLPLFQKPGDPPPRAQVYIPPDLTAEAAVISLLKDANLSSFIHEAGHFFLEVQADLAIKIQKRIDAGEQVSEMEQGIVDDMNTLLKWFGVTGLESASGAGPGALEQPAFHGTPYRNIDKFSTDKIGTGEGAQAYGWGLYFAGKREVAEWYRRNLAENNPDIWTDEMRAALPPAVVGAEYEDYKRLTQKLARDQNLPAPEMARWRELKDKMTAYDNAVQHMSKGQTYEVDIPEDSEMLLWDKPMTEQPAGVRDAVEALHTRLHAEYWAKYDDMRKAYGDARLWLKEGLKGSDLYERLEQHLGSDKEASDALASAGIKGIKYLDGTSRGAGDGSYNYVIFSGDDVAIRNTFYQGGEMPTEGLPPQGRTPLETWSMMSIDEKRVYHEKFAEGFETYGFEGKAPSLELQSAFSRFRDWLVGIYQSLKNMRIRLNPEVRGVMDRMIATDAQIEEAEAARGMMPMVKTLEDAQRLGWDKAKFDAYQAQAAKPTEDAITELQARSLKDMKWMSNARSRALKARQAEVEDLRREVRIEVRAEVYREPVYRAWQFLTGRKPDGPVSEAEVEYDKDRRMHGEMRAEASDALAKQIREELWQASDEAKAGQKGLQKGQFLSRNRGIVNARVAEAMVSWDRENPAPKKPEVEVDMPPGTEVGKLALADLKDRYATQESVWKRLQALRMTTTKADGLDADVVASTILNEEGAPAFDSGDAMVQALATATPPTQTIEERTDQVMLERYGDVASPAAMERAADEAVHNEARARFIAAELHALQASTNVRQETGQTRAGRPITVNLMSKAAKEYARSLVAGLRVRDIRPGQYAAAAQRSGKLAEKAFSSASTAEAAMHKRNQLVNTYAAKEAYDAQAEVKAAAGYFRKFDKRIKTLDPEYQDQIEGLLEQYDFRPASLKAIDKRKAFAVWYGEQVEKGIEPSVPPELLEAAAKQSYKDMTVEQLRGLRDTIKQIEHLGRLKKKLLLAKDQREFDSIADEMAASIVANGGQAREVRLEPSLSVAEKSMDWFEGVAAAHRKLSSYFHQMDGGVDNGPLWQYIGRGMNERGAMEDAAVEQATLALRELYAPMLALKGGITGAKSKVFIPEINASLTRGGRLSVALNMGNADNLQRLKDGDTWTDAQLRAIMKTLSPAELKFVNGIWEYLDTYWPDIAAKEKRLTGVEPERVVPVPFDTVASDGSVVRMTGGYYPLKYDAERSDRASQQDAAQVAKDMERGAFVRSTTRRGHTKARLENVERAVRKDLNVITQHIVQVTHDLAWHEWLIDTNKLLGDDRVAEAIRAHYGTAVLKAMRDQVASIATADVAPMDNIDKSLLVLRSNVSRATMGLSVTTAFLQPFGLTQSMARIGAGHVLRGAARWGGDAIRMENTLGWIHERSDMMRLRSKTFNKELREIRGSVQGKSATMQAVDGGLFWLMQKMQLVADIPTWIAQYEKTMAEGPTADTDEARAALEARAIAQADRAVLESQGGGQTKDLSQVQVKHPMLTQFYSYFNVTLNLTAEKTAMTDFRSPRAVAGWLGDMALLLVIPAILPAALMFAIKGGGDEDDEPADWAMRVAKWQLGYLMGMVVGIREGSGLLEGYDYAGPPVGRIVGDIAKAGKQTVQGEVDEPMVLAYARLISDVFGLPITQVIRSYKGWKAWDEGEAPATAMLFGPPPKD
jgi:hypothetical protein